MCNPTEARQIWFLLSSSFCVVVVKSTKVVVSYIYFSFLYWTLFIIILWFISLNFSAKIRVQPKAQAAKNICTKFHVSKNEHGTSRKGKIVSKQRLQQVNGKWRIWKIYFNENVDFENFPCLLGIRRLGNFAYIFRKSLV